MTNQLLHLPGVEEASIDGCAHLTDNDEIYDSGQSSTIKDLKLEGRVFVVEEISDRPYAIFPCSGLRPVEKESLSDCRMLLGLRVWNMEEVSEQLLVDVLSRNCLSLRHVELQAVHMNEGLDATGPLVCNSLPQLRGVHVEVSLGPV